MYQVSSKGMRKLCANFLPCGMDTSLTLSIDLRRQKKDGTYPLVLRLGHRQSTTTIPLKISVFQKDWDASNRLVRKSFKGTTSVTRLNNDLQKRKNEAMDIIMKLHDAGQLAGMSIADLRARVDDDNIKTTSFFVFTEQLISDLKTACRFGTARSYKGVIAVLKTFTKGKDLQFRDITYQFLTRFETDHYAKGNTANGLSVYVRAIRAIYNKAIKADLIKKEFYPFADYKIKSVPTEKRALDFSFLKKIIELDLQSDDPCFNARNYFLASYMMYGMNFADMAYLKPTDIKNGRIQYRRRKTSKLYDIKLTPNLENILSYYLFPILKRKDLASQDKDIQWSRKCYNKRLKTIALLCGIEQKLTAYVSRHSFATQAMLRDVPITAISAMLGHSSLKTTEIYLKSLPTSVLDDYNARILPA
jgi:site-specific recombinase XerD